VYIEEFEQNFKYREEGKPLLTVRPQYQQDFFPKGAILLLSGILSFFFAIPLFFIMLFTSQILWWIIKFRLPFPEEVLFVISYTIVFILFPPLFKILSKHYLNNTVYYLHDKEISYKSSFPIYQLESLPYGNIIGIAIEKNFYGKNAGNIGMITIQTLNSRPMLLMNIQEPETLRDIINELISRQK